MHLLVSFAAPLSDAGRHVFSGLGLPNLSRLLAAAPTADRDEGDGNEFNPPHERSLARASGLSGADGQLPWATVDMIRDGQAPGTKAWGELTPVHCHVGTGQITLIDPAGLQLEEPDSTMLLDAVRGLFEDEGFDLIYGAPLRWYLGHESLTSLRTASLDRVIGRHLDPWLVRGHEARLWRRLQNEVQMHLHDHPINAERESRGLLPVNSVWLSGCGVAQKPVLHADLRVDARLRAPALNDDWGAWQDAWQALDAGPIAELAALREAGQTVRLTLCGERSAASWSLAPPSLWQRLQSKWRTADPLGLLETL